MESWRSMKGRSLHIRLVQIYFDICSEGLDLFQNCCILLLGPLGKPSHLPSHCPSSLLSLFKSYKYIRNKHFSQQTSKNTNPAEHTSPRRHGL